jgi:hypothetical protein
VSSGGRVHLIRFFGDELTIFARVGTEYHHESAAVA